MPPSLLRVPGFIDEVIDYTLANAPYPEPVLAFCARWRLQAALAGRKVRDPQDNRTAIYLLGLANTGTGKGLPARSTSGSSRAAGMAGAVADGFASGEGLEDRMHLHAGDALPDRRDRHAHAGDQRVRHQARPSVRGHHANAPKLYTSANTIYPLRVKASDEEPRIIDQPCLCLFGTAIPDIFYEALSPKMLSNGFFARMLIFEAGRRGLGQDVDVHELRRRFSSRRGGGGVQAGQGQPEDRAP